MSPFKPTIQSASLSNGLGGTLGFGTLCLFIFVLLGRVFDFYLTGLHIPLLFSIVALLTAFLSGNFLTAIVGSRVSLLMLALTVYMIIGTPFSVWRGGSVEILQGWLKTYLSFLVIIALTRTVADGITILKVCALSSLCVAVLALFHSTMAQNRLALSAGLYSGPNEVANAAILGIITWLFMTGQPKISPLLRAAYLGMALYVGALLPRTGSRGGLLTLGIILVIALFRLKPAMRIFTAASLMAVTMFAFSVLPSDVRLRYIGMFSKDVAVSNDVEAEQLVMARGSSEERLKLLTAAIGITARHPIFGVGLGNFGVERADLMVKEGAAKGSYQGTHNTYLQISSEAGVPAFILFILILYYCWKSIRQVERLFVGKDIESARIRNAAFAMRLLLLSYIVLFLFEHVGYDPFHIVVCALIVAFNDAAVRVHAARTRGAVKTTVNAGLQSTRATTFGPRFGVNVRMVRPGRI